mmetsp:Transcript_58518/g.161966  ORF Transcript_58518/g.161966 Transcript_58518/m.161966 type:complete len:219 (+) Transcript_58518:95-751(+)
MLRASSQGRPSSSPSRPNTTATPASAAGTASGSSWRPRQSLGATPIGGGPEDPGIFNDAHGFLQSVAAELEALKRHSFESDRQRCAEIQELRDLLERQCAERKDTISRLRYEFEEFVHKKIDKILEEVQEMKNRECGDDASQQDQIDRINAKMEALKASLFKVQGSWGKLVASYINPEGPFDPEESLRRGTLEREEQRYEQLKAANLTGSIRTLRGRN